MKRYITQNGIRLFTVDAVEVAQRVGLGSHINTVLQAAFFQIADLMPVEEALDYMKDAARKSYARKGDAVVAKNVAAIEEGAQKCVEVAVPASWADAPLDENAAEANVPAVVENILRPVNAQKGDEPARQRLRRLRGRHHRHGPDRLRKARHRREDARVESPKRASSATAAPSCAPTPPSAPTCLTRTRRKTPPKGFTTVALKGGKNLPEGTRYAIQVSPVRLHQLRQLRRRVPGQGRAGHAARPSSPIQARKLWDFGLSHLRQGRTRSTAYTVKGSQFKQPLLEFSAACAGCGETPYAKLLTQLFGDRVYWANATGCSQAWGSPCPASPTR